jgi:hypothetical protein
MSGLFFAWKFVPAARARFPRHRFALAGMMLARTTTSGDFMQTEQIGDYEIEYAGERLVDMAGWAAFVTVYGPSTNPMHRNALIPHQRVAVEQVFDSEESAQGEARTAALSMLPGGAGGAPAATPADPAPAPA